MKEMKRAVAYARFSSNMQREESIDAQLRAIHTYADAHGLMIVDEYIDRAVSGTSDRRTEFQRMIADSGQKKFEVIIVHKLDRFARSRYDSAHYKFQLKRNAVQLMSVSENLDDSPEATILESVLEGMAEYYSKNLAREVEKGKKENALQGRHVGGVPPLGYAVDPDTKRLVICPGEAEAVRLIFRLFLEGTGYTKIRDTLNARGYKTRRGNSFGKNSLHEILRNEKYTGTYIYNKSASKSVDGHYNRHAYKDEEDVIRVEGLVPAIISRDDYEAVQEKLATRRHRGGAKKAAEPYLLSGRVRCGCCGSAYVGNHRKAYSDHIAYSSYRCSKKNQAIRCPSREIERYSLEQKILQLLAERVFDDRLLPQLEQSYILFLEKRMQDTDGYQAGLKKRREEVEQQISNLVAVIATTASVSLSAKLRDLEQELMQIQSQQAEQEALNREKHLAGNALKAAFYHAKKMLALGTLENKQALVERFVKEVVIFSDHVDVKLNIIGGFQFTEKIQRG